MLVIDKYRGISKEISVANVFRIGKSDKIIENLFFLELDYSKKKYFTKYLQLRFIKNIHKENNATVV